MTYLYIFNIEKHGKNIQAQPKKVQHLCPIISSFHFVSHYLTPVPSETGSTNPTTPDIQGFQNVIGLTVPTHKLPGMAICNG